MQMMERYDANKDGKLTQEEIDQNRTAGSANSMPTRMPRLSLDEFKTLWLKARNEEMVREFQYFDRDGNGQVTLDEYKQPMAGLVADMDQNGDGALSKDDHPQRGEGRGKGRHGRTVWAGMVKAWVRAWAMGQGMMGEGQGMMDQDGSDDDAAPPRQHRQSLI